MSLRPCKECKAQISSDAKICPHCGKKQEAASVGWLAIIIVIAIIGAIYKLVSTGSSSPDSGTQSAPTVTAPVDLKQETLSQVNLDYTWYKDEDVDIMYANFVVKNDSKHSIKDFEITCQHFANSGTNIDSNTRTIYEVVRPHSVKKFPRFNMGFINSQAVKSNCKITDLTVIQ